MTDLSGVGSMMNGDVSGTNLFVGDGFVGYKFDTFPDGTSEISASASRGPSVIISMR